MLFGNANEDEDEDEDEDGEGYILEVYISYVTMMMTRMGQDIYWKHISRGNLWIGN